MTDLKTVPENLSGVKVEGKEDLEAPQTPNLMKANSTLYTLSATVPSEVKTLETPVKEPATPLTP